MSGNVDYKELYRQAEDYFFKAISIKYLNLNDNAMAYMTAVPVADLNMICINNTENLDIVLKQGKQFYDQENLKFIVNIPEELCAIKINNVFKNLGYAQTEKFIAMVMDLKNCNVKSVDNEIIIKATDNKLDDWMIPMIAFQSTNYEVAMKYAETHKLAQEKPIASITLSLHNNIARIDDVGTLPELQGKGYATALIEYALSEAKKSGAIYCFLESSKSGFSIYKKLGFEILFTNNVFTNKQEKISYE